MAVEGLEVEAQGAKACQEVPAQGLNLKNQSGVGSSMHRGILSKLCRAKNKILKMSHRG